MYIKRIVCRVSVGKTQQFSEAQEKWQETIKADGFIAQAGGWDLDNKNNACIISFWDKKESLVSFMKTYHDKIFDGNQQAETYDSIDIKHFDSKFEIKGSSGSLMESIKVSKLFQFINYRLKKDKTEKFQEDFRFPVINRSKGISGGVFSKTVDNTHNYLMSIFWNTVEGQDRCVNNEIQFLQKKDIEKNHLEKGIEKKILLVDSWKILK